MKMSLWIFNNQYTAFLYSQTTYEDGKSIGDTKANIGCRIAKYFDLIAVFGGL